jgi:hypothetical protein
MAIDTCESRSRHRFDVYYVSPIFGTTEGRRSGYVYICPRCGWTSRVLKWQVGAEWNGYRHQLDCEPLEAPPAS